MAPNLGGLLANDAVKQILLWQVLGQLFAPILAPVVQELTNEINDAHQELPLAPADVVEAIIKNVGGRIDTDKEFRMSGLSSDRYQTLIDAAGEPPGLQTLVEWMRRGIIAESGQGADSTSLEQGIRESRLKDKWHGPILAARYDVLSPAQAVIAAVRGNLSMTEAAKLAAEAGVDPQDFETLYHNAGNPPALGELLELYKKGLIPLDGLGPDQLTVQQGVAEGDTKNKWFPLVAELARYIPPPRTVTALLREGSITAETAKQYLEWAGLTPELAQNYIDAASKQHATAQKELSKTEALALYAEGLISQQQTVDDLTKLGMAEADAKDLVTLQDVKRDRKLQQQVVSRVRTLYLGHHITADQATTALRESGLEQAEITHLLSLWGLERQAPQERLTGAQIASAVYYKALTPSEGLAALQGIGYSDFDAWLILADRLHGTDALPPRPPLPAWAG